MGYMKINCVILNYNDWETTRKLVERIHGYETFHQIVVVDNASTDDSYCRLQKLADDKVIVLQARSNAGYGAGNNLGVRYSFQVSEATHVLIANPDTSFTEECIRGMCRMFYHNPDVGVVAASMEDAAFGRQRNGWPLRGFYKELLSMGPVSRRVFRRWLEYPEHWFEKKPSAYVDVVHGSMLMVDGAAFMELDGYDEGIFLYQEEAVLARKMDSRGYRTVLLLNCIYRHEHSVTIKKSVGSQMARQRLRHNSTMYYFKHYLHINRLQEWMAKVWFGLLLLEIWVAERVFLKRSKKS